MEPRSDIRSIEHPTLSRHSLGGSLCSEIFHPTLTSRQTHEFVVFYGWYLQCPISWPSGFRTLCIESYLGVKPSCCGLYEDIKSCTHRLEERQCLEICTRRHNVHYRLLIFFRHLALFEHFAWTGISPCWAFFLDGHLVLMGISLRWTFHLVGHLALMDILPKWTFHLIRYFT